MFQNLGFTEILVIAGVVVLLFGGRKIPELMKGLGTGVREFKKGMRGGDEEKPSPADHEKIEPPKN